MPINQQVHQLKSVKAIFYRDFMNSHIPEILEEIYLKKVYDPYVLGKKDLIIADWGANIGLTASFFSDYAKIVYAVEPSREHQEVIEKLVDFNKIKNIKLCKYAISNENGTTKFYHNENVTMYSLKDTVNNKSDFEEVETVTISEFFKRENITRLDILKWDTEGNESEILASDEFKDVSQKIKIIIGEYHNWTNMNQAQFRNALEDLGFEVHWLYNTHASVFTAIRT